MIYSNPEAERIHQMGLDAARNGDLEAACQRFDEALRFYEVDGMDNHHDTSFARAGIMCTFGYVLFRLAQRHADDDAEYTRYIKGAMHTLDHAKSTSGIELTQYFIPGGGYSNPPEDQASIHMQVCAIFINEGLLYTDLAQRHEKERPGSGKGSFVSAQYSRDLAMDHFAKAREAGPRTAADIRSALGSFLIATAQTDFFAGPEEPLQAAS